MTQLTLTLVPRRELLTVTDLQQALVDADLVDPDAIDDPEGFDNGFTLQQIDALHSRLMQTTLPTTTQPELSRPRRRHDMTEASKPDTPKRVGLGEGLGPLPEPDLLVDCALGFVRGWTKSALDGVLKLAAFGAWCAREFRRDLADVDGGSAQDEMARIGVLELHEALEPCGEGCVCAEYGDFPHECLRLAADVRPLVDGGPNVRGKLTPEAQP